MQNTPKRILRIRDVLAATGLSRSTLYAFIADGKFPKQVSLGPRCVGWRQAAVDKWIDDRLSSDEAAA